MAFKKGIYKTKWVQILPEVGEECPICHTGFLEQGKYGGILCKSCKVVLKLSKYPPTPQKVEVQTKEEYKTSPDKFHEEHLLKLIGITEEELIKRLDAINDRLDKMAGFLREKLK